MLHQELMRIQLILINVSLLNSFSLCMCTDVRWSSQSLSNRALPCVDTVLYLHVYRQCGLTSSRQRILRSQVTMAVPSHDTAITYRYWPTFSPIDWCGIHVTLSLLLLPIFRLVGSVCVSETGAVLWCWGHWLELPLHWTVALCSVSLGCRALDCCRAVQSSLAVRCTQQPVKSGLSISAQREIQEN